MTLRLPQLLLLLTLSLACDPTTTPPTPVSPSPQLAGATRQPSTRPSSPVVGNSQPATPYVLHLPGIGGPLAIDRNMTRGLGLANLSDVHVYDWTAGDPGLNALLAYDRNQQQAQLVADRIVAQRRAHPDRPITVTAHSGGTGIAVWALEKLPPDVHVDTLVLMASALSPTYDLSRALAHVSSKAYAFYSPHDNIVLGTGTRAFGTIDRVKTEAAGMVGFTVPDDPALPGQYDKLVPMPYDKDWFRYGNVGDHIGPMARNFAAHVLAPLLGGPPPPPLFPPATRPAAVRPAAVRPAAVGS